MPPQSGTIPGETKLDALLPLLIAKAVVEVALGFLCARAFLAALTALTAAGKSNPILDFLALGTRPLEALLIRLGAPRISPRSAPWIAAALLLVAWVAVTGLKIERCRAVPVCQAPTHEVRR